MCFTNGSYISWSWMRNADVFSDGEKNTTAVTPERPRVPQSSLKQHLTQPKSASRCTPVESQCMGDEKEQDNRSVILPVPVLGVLKAYKKTVNSRWMFPSPVSEDSPRDPAAVRKRLQTVLERAECKKIRFHDLRHTFSTCALEHGMDVKTLSTIIGHVSSSTTLNIYAHVTDEMRRTAAVKIDQGIGKSNSQTECQLAPRKPPPSTFQAHKGQRRKAGTGCVTQINEKLWEGRYSPIWPDGKRHPRNIYAHSEEECEKLLAEMIVEMKAEITAERVRLKAG